MDKVVLAQLQFLIDRLQVMDGLLQQVGEVSSLRVTLQGSQGGSIDLSEQDQDFSTVLSAVKSIASTRADETVTEIESLIAELKL